MANLTCLACGHGNDVGIPVCVRCGNDLEAEVETSTAIPVPSPAKGPAALSENPGSSVPCNDSVSCQSSGCTYVFQQGETSCPHCFRPRPDAVARPAVAGEGWRLSGRGIEILLRPGRQVLLGRGGDFAEDFAPFGNVHRRHAEARVADDGRSVVITDLNGKNGTFVDGERLPAGGEYRAESPFELRLAAHLTLQVEVLS